MSVTSKNINPPSIMLHLMEVPRSVVELGIHFLSEPLQKTLPMGDGHPVFVIPGLAADDSSTFFLRSFLQKKGYDAYPWDMGRNHGREGGRDITGELVNKIDKLFASTGRKISLVGWSLGGVYAREIAKAMPEKIRMVVTLGSPVTGHAKANNAWRLYEALSGHSVEKDDDIESIERHEPPEVPTTSVYSKSDGIVAWQCSLEKDGDLRENIEISGSHCGLGHNPMAFYVIADRLSQTEGEWSPFDVHEFKTMYLRNDLFSSYRLHHFPHSLIQALTARKRTKRRSNCSRGVG